MGTLATWIRFRRIRTARRCSSPKWAAVRNGGNHGPEDERWTEEFQAAIYREQIDAIEPNEQIAGMTPWILFDFRSPARQNPYQRGYNRKGILDQRGRKKQAFYLLKEFYRAKGR